MNILDSLRPKGSRPSGTRTSGTRSSGGLFSGGRSSGTVNELPLLYVRDAVVFPNALLPVLAATKFCVAAADEAFKSDKLLFVSLLKSVPSDGINDISVHEIGTIAHIVQAVRLIDGTTRLLLDGRRRARQKRSIFRKEYLGA
ncbi:MAG: LON peptidase substrate-binding domain-containing protein, partial [Spirochaetota bacterium]